MSSIGNLTVKKNDGTTDVVWTGVTPSAGAGVPAVWRSLTVGTADSHRPEIRLTQAPSKDGKSTRSRATFVYPQIATDTTTGLTKVVNQGRGFMDWDMPKDMPDADINEFVSQFANLVGGTNFKTYVKERFGPT
jgi:hypothetical protein